MHTGEFAIPGRVLVSPTAARVVPRAPATRLPLAVRLAGCLAAMTALIILAAQVTALLARSGDPLHERETIVVIDDVDAQR